MRRFRRLRAFFTGHFREAFAPAPEPTPPPPPTGGGGVTTVDWQDREQPLPPGWHFAALWYKDARGMVPNPDPTDEEVAGADAIIVRYTDALGTDYRTIHRAPNRQKVALYITYTTIPHSPPR